MRQKQEVRTLHILHPSSAAIDTDSIALNAWSILVYQLERNFDPVVSRPACLSPIRRYTRGRAGRTRGKARADGRRSSTSATRGRDRVTWMVELRGRVVVRLAQNRL